VKHPIAIVLVLLLILGLGIWIIRHGNKQSTSEQPVATSAGVKVTEASASARPSPTQPPQLIGEVILRDYAKTSLTPQNDLILMSHLMENALLLLKSAADRPLSANEDWADFLTGQNAAHERFLPDNHAALNKNRQLVDRWGTPLFFPALGKGRYEVRSAGPDKTLWTVDDLHRNADGSFRHAANLNPPALFPTSQSSKAIK